MKAITPRQQQTLDFIKAYIAEIGCAPAQRDIAEHLGVKPKVAWTHRRALERKGYIYCKPFSIRSIQILERSA